MVLKMVSGSRLRGNGEAKLPSLGTTCLEFLKNVCWQEKLTLELNRSGSSLPSTDPTLKIGSGNVCLCNCLQSLAEDIYTVLTLSGC